MDYEKFNKTVQDLTNSKLSKSLKEVKLGELQDLKALANKAAGKSVDAKKAASDLTMETNEIKGLNKRYNDKISDIETMKKDAINSRNKANKARTKMEDAFQEMKALQVQAGQIVNRMKSLEKELGVQVPGLKELENKVDGMDDTRTIVEKKLVEAQRAYGDAAGLFR